eukprot:CCRYP_001943-RA/>CCRYP_001943-RA protein AED:0.49 eAED:0.52 QI:0/0/0/1/0/0/3/0/229
MSSPTANQATIYKAAQAIITPILLDKIIGQPMSSTVNQLVQQIAKIAAAVKTMSWGGQHGHLALTPSIAASRATWTSSSIASQHLRSSPRASQTAPRSQIERLHNLTCQEFWKQEAANALIADKIVRDAINPTYVEELEDNYVGYSGQMMKTIVQHLRTKWCIVTPQKQTAQAFHAQWDLMSHITKFARELNKQQKLCHDIGVLAAKAAKIQHYVESMCASEMFDDKEM